MLIACNSNNVQRIREEHSGLIRPSPFASSIADITAYGTSVVRKNRFEIERVLMHHTYVQVIAFVFELVHHFGIAIFAYTIHLTLHTLHNGIDIRRTTVSRQRMSLKIVFQIRQNIVVPFKQRTVFEPDKEMFTHERVAFLC